MHGVNHCGKMTVAQKIHWTFFVQTNNLFLIYHLEFPGLALRWGNYCELLVDNTLL